MMQVEKKRRYRRLGLGLLLVLLLAAVWPGIAQGRGPWADEGIDRFLLSRIYRPGSVPRHGAAGPAGLLGIDPLDRSASSTTAGIGDWSKIAFSSFRNGNWEVYIARGDGEAETRLTNNVNPDREPALNRGATRAAFSSRRPDYHEIYKQNADGSGSAVQLTDLDLDEGAWRPAWSPDGTQIAFYAYPSTPANGEIYVVNADGTGLSRLTNNGAWDGHPVWSPDGTKIAFVSNRSGGSQVWTMNPDGSDQQKLTTGLVSAAYPDWSPDPAGRYIALNDDFNQDGWLDLAIINADGTGLSHPLGASPANYDYLAPSWAPNGELLAYAQVRYEDQQWVDSTIYSLDPETGATQRLTESGEDWSPDWQTADTLPPSTEVTAPAHWPQLTFTVNWGGADNGLAGIRSFDVQYRIGAEGTWTDWVLDTADTSRTFTGQHNQVYYFRCRARDNAYNLEPYPPGDGDVSVFVDTVRPSSSASSSDYATSASFPVTWSGSDDGAGIASYDVQVRDGAGGAWTDWLAGTPDTSGIFDGQHDHVYYFRCRARDYAGNLEPYPGGDGDTATFVDTVDPNTSVSSPVYKTSLSFQVTWGGSDDGSGIASYDVQVRDGAGGTWTDWFTDTVDQAATFDGQEGHIYYFRCRARDEAGNLEVYPGGDGDSSTVVDQTPPTSEVVAPRRAVALTFQVSWSGEDAVAGIDTYDVQYRDGAVGAWTDWLLEDPRTRAFFTGELGHTYYFRCRARDKAGNLEAYPGGDGDLETRMPDYLLPGFVWGNREQSVALALVQSSPQALSPVLSSIEGEFELCYLFSGTVSVEASRAGYGSLPPMAGVTVTESPEEVNLYLPPADDLVVDGGFEAGNLAAWRVIDHTPPQMATAAHTGDYAVALGGDVPDPVVTPTAPFSQREAFTQAGGVITSAVAMAEVPPGAIANYSATFSLGSVGDPGGLPAGTQEIGLRFAWSAALSDGTRLTSTLVPVTLTVFYEDEAWQEAQADGEDSLRLWVLDVDSSTWLSLTGVLNKRDNTMTVQIRKLGTFTLLGAVPDRWHTTIEQEFVLTPTMTVDTLSLLYRVLDADLEDDDLAVRFVGPTQTVTYTLALDEEGWTHRWWALPDWAGPTVTVQIVWFQEADNHPLGVLVDEVSLGTAEVGGYLIYLPIVER